MGRCGARGSSCGMGLAAPEQERQLLDIIKNPNPREYGMHIRAADIQFPSSGSIFRFSIRSHENPPMRRNKPKKSDQGGAAGE